MRIITNMKISIRELTTKKKFFIGFLILIFCLTTIFLLRTPSNDRDWIASQKVLPYAEFKDDLVHIHNIRNITYKARYNYITSYYDRTINLKDLVSVDYIIEPFAPIAAAHTFLSFGFSDGSRIAISAESRREEGEIFNPFLSFFREYEMIYTVAEERDVLELRAIHRNNQVYIYPINTTKDKLDRLFISMLKRANEIKEKPEFYNLFTNSCSTNIVKHINEISPGRITFDYRLILPKESDALAYELGLIDNSLPLEELRKKHDVTETIKKYYKDPNFSQKIREGVNINTNQLNITVTN